MPLGSSSDAPVIRPGPRISRSFGRSGCLTTSSDSGADTIMANYSGGRGGMPTPIQRQRNDPPVQTCAAPGPHIIHPRRSCSRPSPRSEIKTAADLSLRSSARGLLFASFQAVEPPEHRDQCDASNDKARARTPQARGGGADGNAYDPPENQQDQRQETADRDHATVSGGWRTRTASPDDTRCPREMQALHRISGF